MSESDCDDESYTSTIHWGEIVEISSQNGHILPDISADIKESMQQNCLDKYPDEHNMMQIKDINLPATDPFIVYAIQLHKWINNMTETIRLAEVATESNLIPPEDAKVPIPEMPDIEFKHKLNNVNFMPAVRPVETYQAELDVPELSEPIVKKLLYKCLAVMTAHIGFEDSFQSVLDVLVDVLDQFFVKICDRFVSALNEEEALDTSGFPNAVERVLMEMGLGGARGLHNYYQCRVIKYISVLQKRCQELEQHYTSLIRPKSASPTDEIGKWFRVRVKKEADAMDSDVDTNYTEGGLITNDYQLLNNLAVEAMQNLPEANDQMMFIN